MGKLATQTDFRGAHPCPCRDCTRPARGCAANEDGEPDPRIPALCSACSAVDCWDDGQHSCLDPELRDFVVHYRDAGAGSPEFMSAVRAYDAGHAEERFHESCDDDGWVIVSVKMRRTQGRA